MNKVTFTIITPTYNRLSTGLLAEALDTIKNQKPGNYSYEHIIVDDGSIDGTKQFVNRYCDLDERIKYVYQKNSGTAQAIRLGVKRARGDFIVILGDDDLLPSNSLFLRAKLLDKNPGLDFFYGKTQWVDDRGKPVKTWTQSLPLPKFPYERMLAENFIQGGTITVKREIYKNIKWPKWLKKSEDYFLAMELFRPENHYQSEYLDKVLYCYRRHSRGNGMQSARSLKSKKLAQERWELDNKIRNLHPPGLAYLSSELNLSWRENRELVQKLEVFKAEKKIIENNYLRLDEICKKEVNRLQKEIDNLNKSLSWKITEPLRNVNKLIKKR